MKNCSYLILLMCVLTFGSSCTRNYYYSPQATHNSQISEKGEIAVSAALGKVGLNDYDGSRADKEDKYQVQAAYSPLKHLAISSSLSFARPNKLSNGTTIGYDTDFAVGSYLFLNNQNRSREYKKIGETKSSIEYKERGFLFDAYLTYGRGQVTNKYGFGRKDMFDYSRYGMKFGMYYRARTTGGRFNKYFSIGLLVRPAMLRFSDATIIGPRSSSSGQFLAIVNKRDAIRINEYTLTGQIGVGCIRLFGNINYIASSREFSYYIDEQAFQSGILLEVNSLFGKNKGKNRTKRLTGL